MRGYAIKAVHVETNTNVFYYGGYGKWGEIPVDAHRYGNEALAKRKLKKMIDNECAHITVLDKLKVVKL